MTQEELKKLLWTQIELSSWSDLLSALAELALEASRNSAKSISGQGNPKQGMVDRLQGKFLVLGEVLQGLSSVLKPH